MIRAKNAKTRRAVTLTELLVVLLIITLLATIAVPVYVNQVEKAKIAIARQEIKEIAHAEEACAAAHGYYVPFQLLDNLIYDEETNETSNPRTDDMYNEARSGLDIYLIDPFRSLEDQLSGGQVRLEQVTSLITPAKLQRLYDNWSGPFLNPQRVAYREELQKGDAEGNFPPESPAVHLDFPLDPWFNPYRFYSPLGLIGTEAELTYVPYGSVTSYFRNLSDGRLTRDDDRFDRFAVVSYGPNMTTSGQFGADAEDDQDDIIYLFGGVFNESSFRIF